jgi:hypothetical protein
MGKNDETTQKSLKLKERKIGKNGIKNDISIKSKKENAT